MSGWIGAFIAVALMLTVIVVRRSRRAQISCPACDTPARVHGPYIMCDECQRFIGSYTAGRAYISRQ